MDKRKSLKNKYKGIKDFEIIVEDKFIKYKEKEYKENDWLAIIGSFEIKENKQIKIKNINTKLLPSTIYKFFCENINKMQYFGLIFPCIMFLTISLISLSVGCIFQNNANFGNFGKIQIFLSILYFLVTLTIFIKIIIGQKAYLKKEGHQNRLCFISKKKYQEIMNCFEILTKEEYYEFKSINKSVGVNNYLIREFTLDDNKNLYNIFKNKNVFKYLLSNEFKNENEALEYIKECIKKYKNNLPTKYALLVNNELIGYIGLSKQNYTSNSCEIIYAIGEEYWGNKHVSNALSVFIPYLISIGKTKIIGGHVKENINSGKVLIKSGFIRYEELDNTMNIHNEEKEIIMYIYNNESINN